MPNILKIGRTRKHPIQRAQELGASTGTPEAFVLEYYRDYADCVLAESLIHDYLDSVRVNKGREFFKVEVHTAIAYLNALSNNAEYRGALDSVGVTGGQWRRRNTVDTSFAELFATFPDDGEGRELTPEEQAKCRQLEKSRKAQL